MGYVSLKRANQSKGWDAEQRGCGGAKLALLLFAEPPREPDQVLLAAFLSL